MSRPAFPAAALLALSVFTVSFGAVAPSPDEAAIRRDLAGLAAALRGSDATAWVYFYTEDAMFVGSQSAPVQGRPALLEMAKGMSPLLEMSIEPQRVEANGALGYAFVKAAWVENGKKVRVRSLLVLRREADGHWRVVQEQLQGDSGAE